MQERLENLKETLIKRTHNYLEMVLKHMPRDNSNTHLKQLRRLNSISNLLKQFCDKYHFGEHQIPLINISIDKYLEFISKMDINIVTSSPFSFETLETLTHVDIIISEMQNIVFKIEELIQMDKCERGNEFYKKYKNIASEIDPIKLKKLDDFKHTQYSDFEKIIDILEDKL